MHRPTSQRTCPRRAAHLAALLALAFGMAGCESEPTEDSDAATQNDAGSHPDASTGGFDAHTWSAFATADEAIQAGQTGAGHPQLKFVLTTFQADESKAHFLDPTFYTLHDEWFWFSLLNGEALEGLDDEPLEGSTFESIEAVYGAYAGVEELPVGLERVGDRIYAPRFYELALGKAYDPKTAGWVKVPRSLGIGSVLYYAANPERSLPEELWLFELEFVDNPNEALLLKFRERLAAVLPPQVGARLRWLARPSLQQEKLAAELRAGGGPLAALTVTYKDLVVPGEIEAYNTGIVAGQVQRFPVGTLGGASVGPEDIVVTEEVPDYMPPVAAIVSGVPQTPLAHLNLLAKARGTPNAYVGGILDDELLSDWAYYHTPVILRVREGAVDWAAMTSMEYNAYKKKLGKGELSIEQVDLESAPYLVDLTVGGVENMAGLIPLVGGKSAGFLALQAIEGVEVPFAPLAISIRAYSEHIAPFVPMIEQVLADPAFLEDARARFVALEGREDYEVEHEGDPKAMEWLDAFLKTHPEGTWLGNVVAAGGLKQVIRARTLAPEFDAQLRSTLETRYATLADTQGLRFRSSSTAEDVEGFNGAGLYDSNSGFLHPQKQLEQKDQKKSVEWALKKTWASYWSFEAFEERRVAGLDHLSGNMGVLVHPRFDDSKEQANGVLTFTVAQRAPGDGDLLEMVLNVQDGALSVTNPEPGNPAKPEIDRVVRQADGTLIFERVQSSTEVPAGSYVFDESELRLVFEQSEAIALGWLEQANGVLPPAERLTTLVLDYELKMMGAGWPAMADGSTKAARLVLKQARTLDRPVTIAKEELKGEAVPHDLLAATVRVAERQCVSDGLVFRTMELYTDPSAAPLFQYDERPFAAYVAVSFTKPIDGLELKTGPLLKTTHTQIASIARPGMPEAGWSVAYTLPSQVAAAWGFSVLELHEGEGWTVSHEGTLHAAQGLTCTVQDLAVGPTEYLQQLLADKLGE